MTCCIVCNSPTENKLYGTKGDITISFCDNHAEDCVKAEAACFCGR